MTSELSHHLADILGHGGSRLELWYSVIKWNVIGHTWWSYWEDTGTTVKWKWSLTGSMWNHTGSFEALDMWPPRLVSCLLLRAGMDRDGGRRGRWRGLWVTKESFPGAAACIQTLHSWASPWRQLEGNGERSCRETEERVTHRPTNSLWNFISTSESTNMSSSVQLTVSNIHPLLVPVLVQVTPLWFFGFSTW